MSHITSKCSIITTVLICSIYCNQSFADEKKTDNKRPVDLVICLDTSGSMTDLIDSARIKLWDVVNELAKMEPAPKLRIGLITYGSPAISTEAQGWCKKQIDLSTNLDDVYEKMMGMTTDGGEEYVGWALNDAVKTMNWSKDKDALKMIFISGNETADQASDKFNFRVVAEHARQNDITINALYAGDNHQGIAEYWDQVGSHGGGSYVAIDKTKDLYQIETPYDRGLVAGNLSLNSTYVGYGDRGEYSFGNMSTQDANAEQLGAEAANSRYIAKATSNYSNTDWDIIDAYEQGTVDVRTMKKEDLPEVMKDMTPDERIAFVEEKLEKRKKIQQEILEKIESVKNISARNALK